MTAQPFTRALAHGVRPLSETEQRRADYDRLRDKLDRGKATHADVIALRQLAGAVDNRAPVAAPYQR